VPATNFVTGDKFVAPIKLVPPSLAALARGRRDTRNAHKTLYLDGKNCAIPSLHRDSFVAKVSGPCPVLSSGNMPTLQSGSPLMRGRLFAKIASQAIS